jgi:hypothetical protein
MCRLCMEELESRWVPADFRWQPVAGSAHNWTEKIDGIDDLGGIGKISNWVTKVGPVWLRLDSYPTGEQDDVFFVGGAGDKDCNVDTNVTVHSMTVSKNYMSTIALKGSLSIPAGNVTNKLYFGSSGTIRGFKDSETGAITRGSLQIGAGANFEWAGGTLADLNVELYGVVNSKQMYIRP